MSWTIHILLAMIILASIKNLPLALFLIFLSHFIVDLLPHTDYSVENILNRRWQKSLPDFLKVALDASLGLLLIVALSEDIFIGLLAGLLAILPDIFTFLEVCLPNKFSRGLNYLHQKVHYKHRDKKTSPLWEVTVIILLVFIFVVWLR